MHRRNVHSVHDVSHLLTGTLMKITVLKAVIMLCFVSVSVLSNLQFVDVGEVCLPAFSQDVIQKC